MPDTPTEASAPDEPDAEVPEQAFEEVAAAVLDDPTGEVDRDADLEFDGRLDGGLDDDLDLEAVFADDLGEMEQQARRIATWGPNVNVKIPVTNTAGTFTGPIIRNLARDGIVLNITAIMTVEQVREIASVLAEATPAIVSVFAGRVADTGVDPMPHMRACKKALAARPKAELLWASPRELLNIFQADEVGCDIITATNDILAKLSLVGKNLDRYSLETVKMFYQDAKASGFTIG